MKIANAENAEKSARAENVATQKTFLFSVDLEEFYAQGRPEFRRTSLPELTERYLDLLDRHKAKATFFVVGEIAEKFPETIRAIAHEGHEIATHTHRHNALNLHAPESLREDLRRNLDALRAVVDQPIIGFRAPVLSLTKKTAWAYDVLRELGFNYSSSVLPAQNPLHGWPEFGNAPRRIDGLLEIPVTLARVLNTTLRVPIGAGTYFRCLPFALVRRSFARLARDGQPIVGYFHPYDIDAAQQRVMSEGVRGSRLLNALLYINRARTLPRLDFLLESGFKITRYDEFAARFS